LVFLPLLLLKALNDYHVLKARQSELSTTEFSIFIAQQCLLLGEQLAQVCKGFKF